jgi:hypothetical protein
MSFGNNRLPCGDLCPTSIAMKTGLVLDLKNYGYIPCQRRQGRSVQKLKCRQAMGIVSQLNDCFGKVKAAMCVNGWRRAVLENMCSGWFWNIMLFGCLFQYIRP